MHELELDVEMRHGAEKQHPGNIIAQAATTAPVEICGCRRARCWLWMSLAGLRTTEQADARDEGHEEERDHAEARGVGCLTRGYLVAVDGDGDGPRECHGAPHGCLEHCCNDSNHGDDAEDERHLEEAGILAGKRICCTFGVRMMLKGLLRSRLLGLLWVLLAASLVVCHDAPFSEIARPNTHVPRRVDEARFRVSIDTHLPVIPKIAKQC